MARIAGVDLPREKRVEVGITYIFGIGLPTAKKIIAEIGINPDTRVKDLTDAEEALAALGELTGKSIREDLVATIFSRFCVGK